MHVCASMYVHLCAYIFLYDDGVGHVFASRLFDIPSQYILLIFAQAESSHTFPVGVYEEVVNFPLFSGWDEQVYPTEDALLWTFVQ